MKKKLILLALIVILSLISFGCDILDFGENTNLRFQNTSGSTIIAIKYKDSSNGSWKTLCTNLANGNLTNYFNVKAEGSLFGFTIYIRVEWSSTSGEKSYSSGSSIIKKDSFFLIKINNTDSSYWTISQD